jgi:hypothetical protein
MINKSILSPKIFEDGGLSYTEVIRQEYTGNNCIISAGYVYGNNKPSVDIIYLRLEKDGVEPTTLLLRPDEIQAIEWVSTGVIWSYLMNQKLSP